VVVVVIVMVVVAIVIVAQAAADVLHRRDAVEMVVAVADVHAVVLLIGTVDVVRPVDRLVAVVVHVHRLHARRRRVVVSAVAPVEAQSDRANKKQKHRTASASVG